MINDENYARLFSSSEAVEAAGWRAELRNDELSDISFNGTPALRAIRVVVRDQDWNTLVPVVRRVAHRATSDGGGTTLLLDIDYEGIGSSYTGELAIHLTPDGLKVTFDGRATTDFRSNRIGLVVLHRPDDAGRPVTIGSPGGASTPSNFPQDISPDQPFLDVSSMEWDRDGTTFRLAFTGDVFETEDQRNWTDASFKTYSTPLSRPIPVDVSAGDRVHQSVLLTAKPSAGDVDGGAEGAATPEAESKASTVESKQETVVTVLDGAAARVPALSVSATSPSAAATEIRLERIPGLDALLVELQHDADPERTARDAVAQAAELGVPLDVRLEVESEDRIPGLLELLPLEKVSRLAVFDAGSHVTEPALWAVLKSEAAKRSFAGTLVAGARSHFTELNRNAGRLPLDAPALTYSITPQMHATEVAHVVETLPIQRLTALNALRIGSGQPLHIGPVTLKARFNAVATSDRADAGAQQASEQLATDALQPEPFAAAWLLGSVAALSVPGVESVSYFEASGPRGIRGPEGFTPAGKLLAALAGLCGADVLGVDGDVPGLVLYPVRDGETTVVFAANLTPDPLNVNVKLSAEARVPGGLEGEHNAINLDIGPWTAVVHRIE